MNFGYAGDLNTLVAAPLPLLIILNFLIWIWVSIVERKQGTSVNTKQPGVIILLASEKVQRVRDLLFMCTVMKHSLFVMVVNMM